MSAGGTSDMRSIKFDESKLRLFWYNHVRNLIDELMYIALDLSETVLARTHPLGLRVHQGCPTSRKSNSARLHEIKNDCAGL